MDTFRHPKYLNKVGASNPLSAAPAALVLIQQVLM